MAESQSTFVRRNWRSIALWTVFSGGLIVILVLQTSRYTKPSSPRRGTPSPADQTRSDAESAKGGVDAVPDIQWNTQDVGRLRVSVVDDRGRPVAGAFVGSMAALHDGEEILDGRSAVAFFHRKQPSRSHFPTDALHGAKRTGADGTAELSFHIPTLRDCGLDREFIYLWVSRAGYVANYHSNDRLIRLPAAGTERQITIELATGRTIRGKLVGPDPAKPQGERFSLGVTTAEERRPSDRPEWSVGPPEWEPKPDFTFQLTDAPRRPIRIVVHDFSHRWNDAEVLLDSDQTEVEIPLPLNPGCRPKPDLVLITDPTGSHEQPLDFVASVWSTSTGKYGGQGQRLRDGRIGIELRRIEPATYHAVVWRVVSAPFRGKPWSVEYWEGIQVVPESGRVETVLEFRPGRRLSLRLMTKSGNPCPKSPEIYISFFRVWTDRHRSVISGGAPDDRGVFAGPVLPHGRARVQIERGTEIVRSIEVPESASEVDETVVLPD